MKGIRAYIVLALLVSLCFTSDRSWSEDTAISRPARIKAAIIYKIAKFVSWSNVKSSFNICASESDPLIEYLHPIIDGKSLLDKPIKIVTVQIAEYLQKHNSDCHILLVDNENLVGLEQSLKQFSQTGTLTICTVDELAWGICIAQIFAVENRARIALDPRKAEKSGLKISSELLDLAVLPE